jgi:uncharacterized membrane protein YeaQ/YmgE (transglycosylase-associated protein family)
MQDSDIRSQIDEWLQQFYNSIESISNAASWKEQLDESSASISKLDDLIYELWGDDGPSEKNFNMVVAVFGAYVATTLRHKYEGTWEINDDDVWLYNIQVGNKVIGAAVFAWVHKRFKNDGTISDRIERLESSLQQIVADNAGETDSANDGQELSGWENQTKIISWLSDEAGIILGAFDCSVRENRETLTTSFSIVLAETPSPYCTSGPEIKIGETDNEGTAFVNIASYDDGRQLTLNITVTESGTLGIHALPHIDVSHEKFTSAQAYLQEVNKKSAPIVFRLESDTKNSYGYFQISIEDINLNKEYADDLNETLDTLLTKTYTNWGDFINFQR